MASSDSEQQRPAIGIDLGTTFSAIAHIDSYGKAQIIPNAENERITPSVILFEGDRVIVGTAAKQNAVAEPDKIAEYVKRGATCPVLYPLGDPFLMMDTFTPEGEGN